ncbi:MAG: hypothetical protein PHE36_13400, partial [Novosphingobium sp.]|nr:hypothetical protein [Novosphingobium sp.]
YWFGVPAAVAGWIRSKLGHAPLPDDEAERQIAYDHSVQAMLETEGYEATARYDVDEDTLLGRRLISMGSSLDRSASSPSGQNPSPDEIRTR